MRMDKLTNPLQQALGDAQSLAVGRDHSMIEPAHVLSAFINQSGSAICRCCKRPALTFRYSSQAWRKRCLALRDWPIAQVMFRGRKP